MSAPDDTRNPPDFNPDELLSGFQKRLAERETPLDVDSLLDDFDPLARGDSDRMAEHDNAEPMAPRRGEAPVRSRVIGPRGFGHGEITDIESVVLPPDSTAPAPELDVDELTVSLPSELGFADEQPARVEAEPLGDLEVPQPDAELLDAMLDSTRQQAAADASVGAIDPAWEPPTVLAMRGHSDPRLLAAWQPGTWVAALRRAHGASSEVTQGPDGPVVETYEPQMLLALWPPQGLDSPLLSRWPSAVLLCEGEGPQALDNALDLVPQDGRLWATSDDIDWALVAEIALHQVGELRPFQIEALRSLIETERAASFARVNDAYEQPALGRPVLRKPEAA